jgi:hypothetical protein
MKRPILLSILAMLALPVESFGQAGGVPNSGATGRQAGELLTRGTLSQSEVKHLAEQIDQWKRVEGNGRVSPREAKARTSAMLAVLSVPCTVREAAYQGTAPNDAEKYVYEAACEDGMGYLLALRGTMLNGSSCLEAAEDESPVKCALPTNVDGKLMAGTLLSRQQVDCKVTDFKWLGTSAANLDHVEVACEGGAGYVMRSPRIGASGKTTVLACQEAAQQGVACQLSTPAAAAAAGPAADSRPTLAWFKEALQRNGVSCESKRARIVGRESIKRRYLVEFECADRPEGLIAYVPPAGDTTNPFESMSCAAAAQRGVRCEWTSKEGAPAASSAKP